MTDSAEMGPEASSEGARSESGATAADTAGPDRYARNPVPIPGASLERLLGELIDRAPDAIVIHDADTIAYVNRRTLELLGDPPRDLVVGQSIWDFLPAELHPELKERVERMRRTGERSPIQEVPLEIPGHVEYWGEFVSSPIQVDERVFFQTVIRDVTQRKRAERAQAESEARYRTLFDAVPVGLYRSRPDGTILDVNQAFLDMLGYPDRETLLGRSTHDVYMDPSDREAWIDGLGATAESVIPDVRLRSFAGEEVHVRLTVRVHYDAEGEPSVFEGAAEDVTDSRRTQARFKFLFETMAQGVVFHDRDGLITVVNPAAERILGVPEGVLIGRAATGPEWEAYYPDGSPYPAADGPVSTALRTGRPVRGAVMGIRNPALDEIRWIEMDSYPLFQPGGTEVQEVYAVFADVTERREADEELRRSERRLERALSGSKLGLWEWNVATGELYLDARWYEMLGYRPHELELNYEDWFSMIHPEDAEAVQAALGRHLAGEESHYEIESRIRTRDGEWRWILDRGQVTERTADGTALRAAGTHTDITDRKRAEEALRSSEERMASMVQAAPVGITLSTLKTGMFLEVNDEFSELVGYTREELVGRTSADLGIWADATDRIRAEGELARTGRLRGCPVRFRTRQGDVRDVQMFTELVDVGGEQCALTMHQDVTESRRLEEQFRQAQKMEAVGRLAGGIAHDFNNLLTALVGHVRFLLDGLDEDDVLRQEVEGIRDGAKRAERLTRQLLAFSRQQMLNPRLVDLREVLDSFESLLGRLIGEDVILEVTHDEECRVRVDPGQLEQVLLNLAVNARDAMPDGGRLGIHMECVDLEEPEEPEHGDAVPAGRYARLTVADTGVGMDAETMDRIFDPFYTTKPVGQGTGLGLSTVYGIISQSSGSIRVDSEPGAGTTFTIFLPVVDGTLEAQQDASPDPGVAPAGGSETILVVEDEEAVRSLAARVLERAGYVVHVAADGEEALELLESIEAVDLLITDVVMPGVNGRELAERLRAERPDLPVIYMSGYTADEVIRDRDQRAAVFLGKPFTPDQLVQHARNALDR